MRIEWRNSDRSTDYHDNEHLYGHIGWVDEDGNKINKYYMSTKRKDGTYLADVTKERYVWHNINMHFATREEAMQWCQMVEDTGAY